MTADLMEAPQFTAIAAAIRCPGCGSAHTASVTAQHQDNLLCKTCGACWHPVDGAVVRVSPQQCAGCSLRRICEAAA